MLKFNNTTPTIFDNLFTKSNYSYNLRSKSIFFLFKYSELKACILPPFKRNNKGRKAKRTGVHIVHNSQNYMYYYGPLSGILTRLHKRLLNLRHI